MKKCKSNINVLFFPLIAVTFLLSGCTVGKILSSARLTSPSAREMLPSVGAFADDIKDILVPPEMVWDRAKSMAIKTESFHGGIWHYSGPAEPVSLKDYMMQAMKDSDWKLVGEAASGNIMLAFIKPHETCMMTISENKFSKTGLTLYITIDKTAAIGLNPFGEAISTK
jgi:hypothetical protein